MYITEILEKHDIGRFTVLINSDRLESIYYTALSDTSQCNSIAYALNVTLLSRAMENPALSAIIVPYSMQELCFDTDKCIILAEYPEQVYYTLHNEPLFKIRHASLGFVESHIDDSAKIHPSAIIAEHVCIGKNVIISPYAVIGENTIIEDNTYIGPHCVISEDGLYIRQFKNSQKHVIHYGGVKIGKNCRIGAHSVVGRAVYFNEFTRLEDDVIVGYLNVISHEAKICSGTHVSSQSLVAGRTTVGSSSWIGAGVTISNSLCIGEKSSIKIGSVVINSLPENSNVSGNFAVLHQKNLKKSIL